MFNNVLQHKSAKGSLPGQGIRYSDHRVNPQIVVASVGSKDLRELEGLIDPEKGGKPDSVKLKIGVLHIRSKDMKVLATHASQKNACADDTTNLQPSQAMLHCSA